MVATRKPTESNSKLKKKKNVTSNFTKKNIIIEVIKTQSENLISQSKQQVKVKRSDISTREVEKELAKWLTLMLEMKTGDSKKEVGLNPGGIVMLSVDLEIGSLAGDINLYLAPPPPLPPPPPPAESCLAVGSTGKSFLSLLT